MVGMTNNSDFSSVQGFGITRQNYKERRKCNGNYPLTMLTPGAVIFAASLMSMMSTMPRHVSKTHYTEAFVLKGPTSSPQKSILPHSFATLGTSNSRYHKEAPFQVLNLSTRDDGLWGSGKSFRREVKTLERSINGSGVKKIAGGSTDQATAYQESKYAGAKRAAKKLVSKSLEPLPEPSLKNFDDKSGVTTSFTKGSAVNLIALMGLGYLVLHPNSSLEHVFSSFNLETLSNLNPADLLQRVVGRVQDMGPMGALYFAGLYILAELLAIPAMPLTASAGYLFGWQEGTAVVLCSATIAASLSFLIARTFLREKVEGLIQQNPRFLVLDKAIGKEGFKLMLLVRLSPIFPFALSNYLYGVTSIPFWQYVWGTFIGFAPGTFLYVYTGEVGKSLLGGESSQPLWVYGAGLAVFAALLKLVADFATSVFEEIEAAEETESGAGGANLQ